MTEPASKSASFEVDRAALAGLVDAAYADIRVRLGNWPALHVVRSRPSKAMAIPKKTTRRAAPRRVQAAATKRPSRAGVALNEATAGARTRKKA